MISFREFILISFWLFDANVPNLFDDSTSISISPMRLQLILGLIFPAFFWWSFHLIHLRFASDCIQWCFHWLIRWWPIRLVRLWFPHSIPFDNDLPSSPSSISLSIPSSTMIWFCVHSMIQPHLIPLLMMIPILWVHFWWFHLPHSPMISFEPIQCLLDFHIWWCTTWWNYDDLFACWWWFHLSPARRFYSITFMMILLRVHLMILLDLRRWFLFDVVLMILPDCLPMIFYSPYSDARHLSLFPYYSIRASFRWWDSHSIPFDDCILFHFDDAFHFESTDASPIRVHLMNHCFTSTYYIGFHSLMIFGQVHLNDDSMFKFNVSIHVPYDDDRPIWLILR